MTTATMTADHVSAPRAATNRQAGQILPFVTGFLIFAVSGLVSIWLTGLPH